MPRPNSISRAVGVGFGALGLEGLGLQGVGFWLQFGSLRIRVEPVSFWI